MSVTCALVLAVCACRRAGVERVYPHGTILAVIAELKIHLERDPYTHPPGGDLNNRNIFRVSLERLQSIHELVSFHYLDILAFARGECLERLGEWEKAKVAFRASESFETDLMENAGTRAAAAARMLNLMNRLERWEEVSLAGYLNELEAIELDLRSWLDENPPWPTSSLVRRRLERVQEERVQVLFVNRMSGQVEKPVEKSFDLLRRMISEHENSWRLMEHWLRLGIYYETLGRDWSDANPPEGMRFHDSELWSSWIESARSAYHHVAQADGNPVKPEGRNRLRALDAYAMRINRLAK
jgi:hypothetical protein